MNTFIAYSVALLMAFTAVMNFLRWYKWHWDSHLTASIGWSFATALWIIVSMGRGWI